MKQMLWICFFWSKKNLREGLSMLNSFHTYFLLSILNKYKPY